MALTKAGNIVLKYPHRKNLIINGNFDIWQRGTSFVGAAAVTASADRWRRASSNDSVVNIAAGSHNANLGSRYTKYALGVSVTTADTSIGAAQYEGQAYVIEGYDVQTIMGQTVTLSFWVYSSLPGTYCVSFRSIAPTYRSYIVEYTINQANTPEYKTITFTMDNGSVGTWDYENSTGLSIFFMLAAGTSLQGTANSWQTANVIATSNQVNFLSATSRSFYLYQVQLELGPVATPFENRPFAEELALCQRYYEKSYNLGAFPGAASTLPGEEVFISPLTGAYYPRHSYKVKKRNDAVPYMYSSVTGAVGYIRDMSAGADVVVTPQVASETSNLFQVPVTDGRLYVYQWVADAEFI